MKEDKTSIENLYIMVLKDFYLITEWTRGRKEENKEDSKKDEAKIDDKSLEELFISCKETIDDFIYKVSQFYCPNLYLSLKNYLTGVDELLYGLKTIKNYPMRKSDEHDIYFSYGFLSVIRIIIGRLNADELSKFNYKEYIYFAEFIDAFGNSNNLRKNYEKNFREVLEKNYGSNKEIDLNFIEKWINKLRKKELSPMTTKKKNKKKKTHNESNKDVGKKSDVENIEEAKEENKIIDNSEIEQNEKSKLDNENSSIEIDNNINNESKKEKESNLEGQKNESQKPIVAENLNNINKTMALPIKNMNINEETSNIQNEAEENEKNEIKLPANKIEEKTELESFNIIESSEDKELKGDKNEIENNNISPEYSNEIKDDITSGAATKNTMIGESKITCEKSDISSAQNINKNEIKIEIDNGGKTLQNKESNENINPIEQLQKEMKEMKEFKEKIEKEIGEKDKKIGELTETIKKEKEEKDKKIEELTERIGKLEINQMLLYNQIQLYQTSRDMFKSIYFNYFDYLKIKLVGISKFDKLKLIIRYFEEKDITNIKKWKSSDTPDISDDLKKKLVKYFKFHFFVNVVTNKIIHRNFSEEQKKLLKANNNNGILSIIPGFDFEQCFDSLKYFIENSSKDEQLQKAMKFVYDNKYINDSGSEGIIDTNKEVIEEEGNKIKFLIKKEDLEEVRNYFESINIKEETFVKKCNDMIWDKEDANANK